MRFFPLRPLLAALAFLAGLLAQFGFTPLLLTAIFACIVTWNSLSPVCSMLSQPGMDALSTDRSLSASQVFCCGMGTICSPVISMVDSP